MKKSTLRLLTLLITSISMVSGFAQSNQLLLDSGITLVTIDEKDRTAIGSPYLYKDFTPAKISAKSDEIFKVRYNAYTDEIEVKISEDKVQNFNKSISNVVITFLNDELKFTSLNYIDTKEGLKRGYFVSLTESNQKVKLFSKKQVKYFEAKPAVTNYDKDKPAEFKSISDTHFISINDAYARELPKKKKEIVKLFPKHTKEILSFIKENKIKTSREEDLIQLINYVNTL